MSIREQAIQALQNSGAAAALTGIGAATGQPVLRAAGAALAVAPVVKKEVASRSAPADADAGWDELAKDVAAHDAGWDELAKDVGPAVGLAEEAAPVVDPSAPGGVEVRTTRIGDKLLGTVKGLARGIADIGQEAVTVDGNHEPYQQARAAGKQAIRDVIAQRGEQSFVRNAAEDLYDVVAALPRLGMSLISEEPVGTDAEKKAYAAARAVPGALVGTYEQALESPGEYVRSMPFSTALDVIPATKAAKSAMLGATSSPLLKPIVPSKITNLSEAYERRVPSVEYTEGMSSAQAHSDNAKRVMERIEAGEQVPTSEVISATGGETTATLQRQDIEAAELGRFQRENLDKGGNFVVAALRRLFSEPTAQRTPYQEAKAARATMPLESDPTHIAVESELARSGARLAYFPFVMADEQNPVLSKVDDMTKMVLSSFPDAGTALKNALVKEGIPDPERVVGRLTGGYSAFVPQDVLTRALGAVRPVFDQATVNLPKSDIRRAQLTLPEDYPGTTKHIAGMEQQALAGGLTRMEPEIAKSVLPQLDMEAGRVPGPVTDFLRVVKGNLVAANPSSILNNAASNVLLQSFRRGVEELPLIAYRAAKLGRELVKDSGDYRRTFQIMRDLKLLDTDAVANEIKTGPIGKIGEVAEKVSGWGGILPAAYQWGDKLFKLEETVANLNKYRGYIDNLKNGEFLELRMSPRYILRVMKDDTGNTNAHVYHTRGTRVTSLPIPVVTDLDRISPELVRAAAQPALDAFFDYSDIPNYLKAIRGNTLTTLASPFVTWAYKAMDLPGKRGLGYEAFVQPSSVVSTNSRSVHSAEALNSARRLLSRALIMGSARQELLRDDSGKSRELAQAISFMPTEPKIALIRAITSPGNYAGEAIINGDYAYAQAGGNWNFLDPTERAMRLAAQLYYRVNPSDMKDALLQIDRVDLTPEQRKEARRTLDLALMADGGRLTSPADVMKIMGLGGNVLAEVVGEFDDATDSNRSVDIAKILKQTMMPLTGAGPIAQAVINAVAPASSFADSVMVSPDPAIQESVTRAFVRRLLGMTWKTVPLFDADDPKTMGRVDDYFKKLADKLKESAGMKRYVLDKQLEKASGLRSLGQTEEADRMVREVELKESLIDLIDQEVQLARENWIGTITKIQQAAKKQPRK